MTVRQFRITNKWKNEEFQKLIESENISYDTICYDDDNTITIITSETIPKLKDFKSKFEVDVLDSNVLRKVNVDLTGKELAQVKITKSDFN